MVDASLATFRRDLDDLGDALEDTSRPVAEATAALARDARSHARRLTGYMADHIVAKGNSVEAEADYSPIVHNGWHNIATPNPFLDQAIEDGDYLHPFAEHIEHALHGELRTHY